VVATYERPILMTHMRLECLEEVTSSCASNGIGIPIVPSKPLRIKDVLPADDEIRLGDAGRDILREEVRYEAESARAPRRCSRACIR
jgi:hypothetical protein